MMDFFLDHPVFFYFVGLLAHVLAGLAPYAAARGWMAWLRRGYPDPDSPAAWRAAERCGRLCLGAAIVLGVVTALWPDLLVKALFHTISLALGVPPGGPTSVTHIFFVLICIQKIFPKLLMLPVVWTTGTLLAWHHARQRTIH